MARWGFFDSFYPSRPRAAKGGIKSRSRKGEFAENWWGKRWIEVLESFPIGARLTRGRSYARSGQVLSVDVEKGGLKAQVQGSRASPYSITIKVKPLKEADWSKVARNAAEQAMFATKLLAGQMPENIEEIFRGAGCSLFPGHYTEFDTDCSCPDWSDPCKHIAAVYYILGEEFDRDPFLIFRMRGIEREEFIAKLGQPKPSKGAVEIAAEPLPSAPAAFWSAGELPIDLIGEAPQDVAGAAIARRLGAFPFWRGSQELDSFLAPIYERAARAAADTLAGRAAAEDSNGGGASDDLDRMAVEAWRGHRIRAGNNWDDSYLWDLQRKLTSAFRKVSGVPVIDDDLFEFDEEGEERSYLRFFVQPKGSTFRFVPDAMEDEVPDDFDDFDEFNTGQGFNGWFVVVSFLDRVAMVMFRERVTWDDGITDEPTIGNADETAEQAFRDQNSASTCAILDKVRDGINQVLERSRIRVLTEAEGRRQLAGFQVDPEIISVGPNEIRVQDAFFFEEL